MAHGSRRGGPDCTRREQQQGGSGVGGKISTTRPFEARQISVGNYHSPSSCPGFPESPEELQINTENIRPFRAVLTEIRVIIEVPGEYRMYRDTNSDWGRQ